MDRREAVGLEMAFQTKVEWTGAFWLVPSQTSRGLYKVNADATTCTCEDFDLHRQPCKHIHAVRVVKAKSRAAGADEQVYNDLYANVEAPKKPICRQDWPNYNKAQTQEKRLFCDLLADLCRTVPEPPRTTGRKPVAIADAIFSAAYKVYSTVSGRRFTCDLQDAEERGHVTRAPHYNSVFRVFEDAATTPILYRLIEQSSLPLAAVEETFAVDSSGFGTSRFEKWFNKKYKTVRDRCEWVKCHIITGVKTNVITAVAIGDEHDSKHFAPLVEATAKNFGIKEVAADKAYISRDNLEMVERLGASPFIPFKAGTKPDKNGATWKRLFHEFNANRAGFCKRYHQRSNVESTFSMVKAKFSDFIRSKTDVAMTNEVLAKILCHNVVVCIHEMFALGIDVKFGGTTATASEPVEQSRPWVLKFPGA